MEEDKKKWEIKNDEVLLYTPLYNNVYQITPIMSKEIFIECYKKWIKEDED